MNGRPTVQLIHSRGVDPSAEPLVQDRNHHHAQGRRTQKAKHNHHRHRARISLTRLAGRHAIGTSAKGLARATARHPSWTRRGDSEGNWIYTKTMFRKGLTGAGATLVLFHVWVLSDQMWKGQVAESGRLLRWAVAFALFGALVALKRRGASLFRGRKPVAIWLLAVLLHGPSVADRVDATGVPALPQIAGTLAQIALASLALAALGLLIGFRTSRKRPAPSFRTSGVVIRGGAIGILSPDAFLRITPRPPPRA